MSPVPRVWTPVDGWLDWQTTFNDFEGGKTRTCLSILASVTLRAAPDPKASSPLVVLSSVQAISCPCRRPFLHQDMVRVPGLRRNVISDIVNTTLHYRDIL